MKEPGTLDIATDPLPVALDRSLEGPLAPVSGRAPPQVSKESARRERRAPAIDERQQAQAPVGRRPWEPAHFAQRGEDVDEADTLGAASGRRAARRVDEQRHVQDLPKERRTVAPRTAIPQFLTVIRGDEDQRVPLPAARGESLAQALVESANAAVIGRDLALHLAHERAVV